MLNKKGFTLVELLIAISFFSFLLLFVTFGFVQVNRIFTKGVTVKTIQETSRGVLEDISRAVRTETFLGYIDGANGGQYRICFEGVRYAWNQHDPGPSPGQYSIYDASNEVLDGTSDLLTLYRSADNDACLAPIDPDVAEEILDNRAAVQHLSVTQVAPQTYNISLVVSTRGAVEEDLTQFGRDAKCKVQAGDQFCDVSFFETVVTSRN